jgi:hypothetical protein
LTTAPAAIAGPGAEADGCTFAVRALPTVLRYSHGHASRGRWRLSAASTCPGVVDMTLSADLTRNGVPLSAAHVTATCGGTQICGSLTVSGSRKYSQMSGRWQPRLVVYVRGSTSLVTLAQRQHCVLDIPSFKTICTVVGPVVVVR